MIKETNITELSIGAYITDIAKQNGHHTLSKPGFVKSATVIEHLIHKGVETVLVDTSKDMLKMTGKKSNEKQPTFKEEITQAKKLFDQSKEIQRAVFAAASSGRRLDMEQVESITEESTEAIFKNPDALACVINIRKKDEYLLEHSVSVSILVTIFAKHLNIDRGIIKELAIGAYLHDVGKIKVPDVILNKPGKLTHTEFDVMKSHVKHSIDIIKKNTGINELSLEVAAQHHEKLDGQGYPFKLEGKNISIYGRMVAICDIFDALTANRCYKDGFSHVKAFGILRKLAELKQLDNTLVDSFIKCMGVFPVGSLVRLNSNKLAIVETRNQTDPIRPKVKSFYNVSDALFVIAEEIDLSTSDEDQIMKGVRADDFDLDMGDIVEFLLKEG